MQHWVSVLLAVYGAALLGASPICGYVADRTASRRLPLLIGLLALAGATILLCLGTSLTLLIIGRVLQGIAAAIVWTVGLALLVDTVGPEVIGQSMGYVSISMSLAVLVAPLLGGVVYDKAGYYSVYYLAFGMILLDIILRVGLVEKTVAKQWEIQAMEPAVVSPADRAEKVDDEYAGGGGEGEARDDAEQLSLVQGSGEESKKRSKTVILLTSRRLLAALYCTLTQSVLLTAWDAVLPLYVNKLFGWSSLGAGLIFLPLMLPSFLAPLVGYWSDKKGPRWPTTVGFITAIPFLVLLRLVDHSGIRQVVLLCALLALLGFAVTSALTPLMAEITYVVSHKEKTHPGVFAGRSAYATAYGLFNTAFAGGMLVGPIWGGFVTQNAGWAVMCWSLAVLSVGGASISFLFGGGWIGGKRKGGQCDDNAVATVDP